MVGDAAVAGEVGAPDSDSWRRPHRCRDLRGEIAREDGVDRCGDGSVGEGILFNFAKNFFGPDFFEFGDVGERGEVT